MFGHGQMKASDTLFGSSLTVGLTDLTLFTAVQVMHGPGFEGS